MSNTTLISVLLNILFIGYVIVLIGVSIRIILDSKNSSKALGYLLLINFLPVVGIIAYIAIGGNYRKRKIFSRKLIDDKDLMRDIEQKVVEESENVIANQNGIDSNITKVVRLLVNETKSPLSTDNTVTLLNNGEDKLPDVLRSLSEAKNHIHLLYYIFEDDAIGRQIESILVEKARQGVEVRFIYDDFGSRGIQKKMIGRLKQAGVEVFPFYELNLMNFASRLNYRNHRKIIVVDGLVGYVGGINISTDYVNDIENGDKLFWRDTHIKIEGSAVYHLQYIFLADWNFCASQDIEPNENYFPQEEAMTWNGDQMVQIVSSGPDSDFPSILHSIIQLINTAKKEVLITTPYLIPGSEIATALHIAAKSGIEVKILIPKDGDSKIVDWASASYFEDLLNSNVNIYRYTKGFIHAKTMVVDQAISVVGTANMDTRSFELNFEINAVIYDASFAEKMTFQFKKDLENSVMITEEEWTERSTWTELKQNTARLLSPVL